MQYYTQSCNGKNKVILNIVNINISKKMQTSLHTDKPERFSCFKSCENISNDNEPLMV